MAEVLTDDKYYNDIAAAIRSRYGGTTKYLPREMAAAITETTDEIGIVEEKDINFYDFDGTLFASYTFEEASVLKEYPRIPHYDDTLLKGWTASLDTIRSVNYKLDVGAIRRSDDDATKLYLEIVSTDDLTVTLTYKQTIANDVVIDWGDGSNTETFETANINISLTHTYSGIGNYIISIYPQEGRVYFLDFSRDIVHKLVCGKSLYLTEAIGLTKNLTEIILSDDIFNITDTFHNCLGIEKAIVPLPSYTKLDGTATTGAFYNCSNLRFVILPEGLSSIGDGTFGNCTGLTEVTLPNNVLVQNGAFAGCSNLSHIVAPEGVIINPKNSSSKTDGWLKFCNITTAGEIGGGYDFEFGWKKIPDYCFYNLTKLKSANIPEGVTTIGEDAFYKCSNLSSVEIGKDVKQIQAGAFYQCTALSSVSIPDGTTYIGTSAFNGCTKLSSVTLGDELTNINSSAFEKCSSLRNIIIPSSVTNIGSSAFYNCVNLYSVIFEGDNINFLGSNVFQNCIKLQSIVIPNGVTTIYYATFYGCTSLANVTIGENVTHIGGSVFKNCSQLHSIVIPESVVEIGDYAFENCPFTEIHFKGTTPPTFHNLPFSGFASDLVIYIPQGTLAAYQEALRIHTNLVACLQEET